METDIKEKEEPKRISFYTDTLSWLFIKFLADKNSKTVSSFMNDLVAIEISKNQPLFDRLKEFYTRL